MYDNDNISISLVCYMHQAFISERLREQDGSLAIQSVIQPVL